MKVQFTRTIGRQDCLPRGESNPDSPEFPLKPDGTCYRENETADLAEDVAVRLLERGLVVQLKEAKEAKK